MRAGLQRLQLGSGVLDTKYRGVGGHRFGGLGAGGRVFQSSGHPPTPQSKGGFTGGGTGSS